MISYASDPTPDRLHLSPTASYYIRRLLRENLNQPESMVALASGVQADPLADLNVVIEQLYSNSAKISLVLRNLERLALCHQILSNQGMQHQQELEKIHQEIFWLLGFKQKLQQ
jgi:hypothetical protein